VFVRSVHGDAHTAAHVLGACVLQTPVEEEFMASDHNALLADLALSAGA
jgi:hypothetical protein